MRLGRFISLLLLFAILVANNVHLPLMQMVAWSRMFVLYSRVMPVAEAVEMTFDGDHPCPMCQSIKKAQTSSAEKDKLGGLSESRMRDLCGVLANVLKFVPPHFAYQRCVPARGHDDQALVFPPPTPPPICAQSRSLN